MNEDGYGASDKEQEMNDLYELSQKITDLAGEIDSDFCDIDEKYAFNAVVILQDLALAVDRKIQELREPGEPDREDEF
jgi:hypothetical protein